MFETKTPASRPTSFGTKSERVKRKSNYPGKSTIFFSGISAIKLEQAVSVQVSQKGLTIFSFKMRGLLLLM